MFLFTFGILTLQPTAQPKTKSAGLLRHQVAIFVFGLPSILFGTLAVSYNKWLKSAEHFTTWHGTIGILCIVWLLLQAFLGAGSVWFSGALFGGGMKPSRYGNTIGSQVTCYSHACCTQFILEGPGQIGVPNIVYGLFDSWCILYPPL